MKPHPLSLQNRLRVTRRKRGLSRKRLAAWLGHQTTAQLCRWEQGMQIPTLSHALLLAHLLQLPVELLFQGIREDVIRRARHAEDDGEAEIGEAVIEV